MKLRVIWIGRTKNPSLAKLTTEFAMRIRRFSTLEISELTHPKTDDPARQIQSEGKEILRALGPSDRVIMLDATGKMWSSIELASFLEDHFRQDPRRLTFIIGGHAGLAESVKKRADRVWSLSPLTFTHDMTRVLVLEQIYRALASLRHHPYSKL